MKLTVDIVLFGYVEKDLKVLLIKRRYPPFENEWAFPGGFVNDDESLEDAVNRKLNEETGVHDIFTEQLYTFGATQRDPRERVLSVAYYGLINTDQASLTSSYEMDTRWFSIDKLPKLAFDHQHIFDTAIQRLRGKVSYQPIGFELLPEKFTMRELQTLYETILDKPFDQSNFGKKMLRLDILEKLDEKEEKVNNRPAVLYRFNATEYNRKLHSGFYFEIRYEK